MTLMVTAPSSPIMAGPVAFDESAMQQLQEEQQTLLDTIDELRNLGLSNVLHLPQIVVVGDQCAGKSSVLEAISRVRFPIKDGICTRFPTELVLRQSYSRHTKVEVRAPGDSPDKNHTFNRAGFTKDDLPPSSKRPSSTWTSPPSRQRSRTMSSASKSRARMCPS